MTTTEDRLDAAFATLADPTRRAIVSRLARGDATVGKLAAPFDMSLPGISKHLKVFERGRLISRGHDDQFRPCHLEVEALDGALDWIGAHRRLWDERFDKLDALLAGIQRAPARTAPRRGKARPVHEHGGNPPNELRFTRVFAAPRELVFRCMIDPDHPRTSGARRGSAPPRENIEVDARPGGVFETLMVNDSDGNEYADAGHVRPGAPARAAGVDRSELGHARAHGVRRARARPHGGADPPDVRARGVPAPRGPGRVLVLARPLRHVSRPGHPATGRPTKEASPFDGPDDRAATDADLAAAGRGRNTARWPTCSRRRTRRYATCPRCARDGAPGRSWRT